MPYDFYKSLLTVSSSPSQEYIDDLQALINQQFDNASSLYTVKEETSFGSGSWRDVTVRLSKVSQAKSGSKLSDDDFKLIQFKNLSHAHSIGSIYKIDNVYWLSLIDKDIIRKCNNTLSFVKNSTSYSVPCVVSSVGQNLGFATEETKYVSDIDDFILVRMQNNTTSRLIAINDIFTIGRYNWQVQNISDVIEPNIIVMKMKWAAENPSGNTDTSTESDQGNITYIVSSTNQPDNEIKYNATKVYTAQKFVDDVEDEDAVFTFAIVASGVPSAAYTLTAINSESCSIKCNAFAYDIALRVTDTSNSNYVDKTIRLKSVL